MSLPTGLASLPAYPPSFGAAAGGAIDGRVARMSVADSTDGAGAAGVYTVSIIQPGGSFLLDVGLYAVALWNQGTSATGIVGDTTDDDGIFTGVNLKATDLLAGESISTWLAGGKAGADIANSQWNRRYAAADRAITFKNTTDGTAATTGETLFFVAWYWPTRGLTPSTFVAS